MTSRKFFKLTFYTLCGLLVLGAALAIALWFFYERANFIGESISPDGLHKVVLKHAGPGPEDIGSYSYELFVKQGGGWTKQASKRCLLPVDPYSGKWLMTQHSLEGWKDNQHFKMRVDIPNNYDYGATTITVDISTFNILCSPNNRKYEVEKSHAREAEWRNQGCKPYHQPIERKGKVKSGHSAYYLADGDRINGCPSRWATCRTGMVLRSGTPVVIGKRKGPFVCAMSVRSDHKGWDDGWLLAEDLVIDPKPIEVPYTKWLGWWRNPEQNYSIEVLPEKDGKLKVVGNAVYHGCGRRTNGTCEKTPYYNTMGDVVTPKGNQLIVNPGNCQTRLTLVDDFLIASALSCSYSNASLQGIYQKFHSEGH